MYISLEQAPNMTIDNHRLAMWERKWLYLITYFIEVCGFLFVALFLIIHQIFVAS